MDHYQIRAEEHLPLTIQSTSPRKHADMTKHGSKTGNGHARQAEAQRSRPMVRRYLWDYSNSKSTPGQLPISIDLDFHNLSYGDRVRVTDTIPCVVPRKLR